MKIAMTGGPAAGKTTIAEILARSYMGHIAVAPEAASILFRGGFPRRQDMGSMMCQQRAIYHVQREVENAKQIEFPDHVLLCDRGSLDGLAYWPAGAPDFFAGVGTTMEKEIARYDWVLHLDTAAAGAYHGDGVRIESYATATHINEAVKAAWARHPQRVIIANNRDFSAKIVAALLVMKLILARKSLSEIEQALAKTSS